MGRRAEGSRGKLGRRAGAGMMIGTGEAEDTFGWGRMLYKNQVFNACRREKHTAA